MTYVSVTLDSRLKNCLHTILDLEACLAQSHLGNLLEHEFSVLKKVASTLELSTVNEIDVERIEAATARFLEELKLSFKFAEFSEFSQQHLLH